MGNVLEVLGKGEDGFAALNRFAPSWLGHLVGAYFGAFGGRDYAHQLPRIPRFSDWQRRGGGSGQPKGGGGQRGDGGGQRGGGGRSEGGGAGEGNQRVEMDD